MRRQKTDPLEREIELALNPGAFIPDRACFSFVRTLAARLWRAQGMRIVGAKKSEYYNAALSNFERAMRCYAKAGLTAEWEETVNRIRTEHHRKTGFMPGFEDLAAGCGPSNKPSFLERAKAR